jgi:hypothetical protein
VGRRALVIGASLTLGIVLISWSASYGSADTSRTAQAVLGALVLVVPSSMVALRARARTTISPEGVTTVTPLHTVQFTWAEIERFAPNPCGTRGLFLIPRDRPRDAVQVPTPSHPICVAGADRVAAWLNESLGLPRKADVGPAHRPADGAWRSS